MEGEKLPAKITPAGSFLCQVVSRADLTVLSYDELGGVVAVGCGHADHINA